MKTNYVVKVVTENYIEEQLMLKEFPDSIWVNLKGKTIFFIPLEKYDNISKIKKRSEKGEGNNE